MISCERAEEIANLYYDDIYHMCLFRVRKEEDARDVVQEVFLLFQQHCEDLKDEYIKNWLYNVADKKIKEQFRKIAKREKELIFGDRFEQHIDEEYSYSFEPDDLITNEEIEEKKADIILSLTRKEIQLFEMVYVKHLEYEELANALGISVNNARTRVYRLNVKIKEKVTYAFMALLLLLMRI